MRSRAEGLELLLSLAGLACELGAAATNEPFSFASSTERYRTRSDGIIRVLRQGAEPRCPYLPMLRFGIWTEDQFIRAGERRRFSGSRVAYTLLNIGENPTSQQVQMFEEICFTLRTSNGTFRTTFRNRLRDVDAATIAILKELFTSDTELLVEDRAVSHGLTSLELARQIFQAFPQSRFEASDKLLYLVQISLASGESYVLEPDSQPLQYIKPPFVVSLAHGESIRFPINRLIAAQARRRLRDVLQNSGRIESIRGDKYQIRRINCVHPEVTTFMGSNPRFQLRTRSVFDITPNLIDVLRTMNILNKDYFSDSQLRRGSEAVFQSLKLGGVWIVGRTLESNFSNHVSFLQKVEGGWKILSRIGNGSEAEQYAVNVRPRPCTPVVQ